MIYTHEIIIIKNNIALSKFGTVGRLIGLLLVLVGIITASIVQIDAGEIDSVAACEAPARPPIRSAARPKEWRELSNVFIRYFLDTRAQRRIRQDDCIDSLECEHRIRSRSSTWGAKALLIIPRHSDQ